MDKLPKIVRIGSSGVNAHLIKRTKRVAMYLRDDGYYEVGKIKISEAEIVFGKEYPDREIYWSNEDIGNIAKTTSDLKRAEHWYKVYNS